MPSVDDDDSWDSYADGWDQDEGARAYAAAAFASLQAVLASASIELDGAEVVDFGCGTGLLTERLADLGAVVHAVDTSPAMLAVLDAKVARRGWSTVTTGEEIPSGTTNDLIVCSSVCSFLEDYPGTAAELVGLLRVGGLFVQWDWERPEGEAGGHGLTRAEIDGALRAAGLEDIVVDVGFEISMEGQMMRPLIGHGRRGA